MNIKPFKDQHLEILVIVDKIEGLCQHPIINVSKELSMEIIRLRFKVKLHLSVEDNLLYPKIPVTTTTNNLAEKYKGEMLLIADGFFNFCEKWDKADAIKQNPDEFFSDATQVIRLLKKRIQKENTELYPAIEVSGQVR